MAGTIGSRNRKILVAVLATLGCVALLLFCARLVYAAPVEASWYGPGFEGNLTANGEVFDPSGYTAAHKTYAFDTKLIVTYEGRSVVVRINDRGPYVAGRELDLSQGAADYIGLTSVGVGIVDVQEAAPSTPVGPYAAPTDDTSSEPSQQAAPAASGSPDKPDQNRPARQQNGGNANGNSAQAVEDQYASEDQYAAEGQSEEPAEVQEAAPEPPPPAPKPAVPVLPPEPEPEALLSPPTELAVPNSTVQKRVEFRVAAAPTPQPVEEEVVEPAPEPVEEEVVEPAPEPVEEEVAEPAPEPVKEVEEPSEQLTVLPDTGGASPILPIAGALLIGAGLSIRILRR
ncbi:hypothetical protein BH24ACT22_BH24ACT22_13300 [soil metagenome]